MVRGLDYYTGVVAETFFSGSLAQYGSIASGGRYDKLVDIFVGSETNLQGVGISIGVTRLFSILFTEKMLDVEKRGNSHVCVGFRTQGQWLKAIGLANTLRNKGYNVDVYSGNKNIVGQLTYAGKKTIPYMLMVMDEKDSFVLKDMLDTADEKGTDFKTEEEAIEKFIQMAGSK